MEVIRTYNSGEIATVFLGRTALGNEVEFVESIQLPLTRSDKEVIIVSTLVGCPIGCKFCDAGGFYRKKLTASEIFEQIDWVVHNRYGDRSIPSGKFKIQFARMGEPSLNDAVLDVLEELPRRYDAPGLLPSLSSVAPKGRDSFFERLLKIKHRIYTQNFRLQFSIHSTDEKQKRARIPVETWGFERMSDFGLRFINKGDKISLNFVLARDTIIESDVLARYFRPESFLIKITPVNPTYRAAEAQICSGLQGNSVLFHADSLSQLRKLGFEVLLSIGEPRENAIGSNCGQFVRRHLENGNMPIGGYQEVSECDKVVPPFSATYQCSDRVEYNERIPFNLARQNLKKYD